MTAPTTPLDLDAIRVELQAIADMEPAAQDSTGALINQRLTRAWANVGRHVPALLAKIEQLQVTRDAAEARLSAIRSWMATYPAVPDDHDGPLDVEMLFVQRLREALGPDAPVEPGRTWTPGDSPVLPSLPESAYPAGATPLEPLTDLPPVGTSTWGNALDTDTPMEPARCTCDHTNDPPTPHRAWCATRHQHPGPDCAGLCEPDSGGPR